MKDNSFIWGLMVAFVIVWLAGYMLAGVNLLQVVVDLVKVALAAG